MGLFNRRKKGSEASEHDVSTKVPQSIEVDWHDGMVCSPVSGEVVGLADVGDPVFSGGMLGAGCGIRPRSDVLLSPVSGTITATTPTNHAIGITSLDAVDVLVHIGIDTVEMMGRGFVRLVSDGDAVKAGEPLLTFDRVAISEAGYDTIVICVVSNTAVMSDVQVVPAPGQTVDAGQLLLRVTR